MADTIDELHDEAMAILRVATWMKRNNYTVDPLSTKSLDLLLEALDHEAQDNGYENGWKDRAAKGY